MKQKNLVFIIIILGFFFFLIFHYSDIDFKNNKLKGFDSTRIGSNIRNRIFLNSFKFKLINQFDYHGISQDFFSYHNRLYFINSSNCQIECFNYNGSMMKTMGRKGEAPWENNIIHYIEPTDFGFYVFDSGSQALKKFDKDYKLLKFKKTQGYVLDVCRLKDNLFLIPFDESEDNFEFILFDFGKDKEIMRQSIKKYILEAFGEFPTTRSDIIFSGYFRRNTHNQLVYVFQHFGAFILFNSNGSIKKIVRTIDGFNLPKPIDIKRTNSVTELTISPDIIVNYSSSIDKENIYILSNVYAESEIDNRVIDVYRLFDGGYSHSLILPNQEDGQKSVAIATNSLGILSCLNENMLVKNYFYDISENTKIK